LGLERLLDQVLVGIELEAVAVPLGERAERAVGRVDVLERERLAADHFLPDVGEAAAGTRHLELAGRWTDGLRGQARILDLEPGQLEAVAILDDQPLRRVALDVAHAEDADAVEQAVRARIPEIALQEHRIDGGGGIAWLDLARRTSFPLRGAVRM